MKKGLFILVFLLFFLVSCDGNDNNTSTTLSDNKVTSSIVTNENPEPSIDNSSNDETISNDELPKETSPQNTSQGNVENGGEYTEGSDDEWIYLG